MDPDLALATCLFASGLLALAWSGERKQQRSRLDPYLRQGTTSAGSQSRCLKSRRKTKQPDLDLASACTQVAARLRAGEPAHAAWTKTLGPTPVEQALNQAGPPGATVALALKFSEHSGAPLAQVMDKCAQALESAEEAARARDVAFAGPRASMNVLSVLPWVGLAGAQALGAKPLQWFFSGPWPLALLALGLAFAVGGRALAGRMVAKASLAGRDSDLAPTLCDLAVAGMRCGQSVPSVLQALAAGGAPNDLARVGTELQLGASWDEAWTPAVDGCELLQSALEPAWQDGVSPIPMLQGAARRARGRAVGQAKQAAERLAVKLAFPLGFALLPSFVVLGLVPVFFSLVADGLPVAVLPGE